MEKVYIVEKESSELEWYIDSIWLTENEAKFRMDTINRFEPIGRISVYPIGRILE